MDFIEFKGEFIYSGDSIGMANGWLYVFVDERYPGTLYQLGLLNMMGSYMAMPVDDFDLLGGMGIDLARNKFIDTDAMLDSDEFAKALAIDPMFGKFQTQLQYDCMNLISVGAFADNFGCANKEEVIWMRYLIPLGSASELCCKMDYNDATLSCIDYASILEDYSTSNISVFPSPTKDFINISNPENEIINSISIYDVEGKILLISNNKASIDVSLLPTGNYFICFEVNNKKVFRSLIVL
jgi:hypothetical protein